MEERNIGTRGEGPNYRAAWGTIQISQTITRIYLTVTQTEGRLNLAYKLLSGQLWYTRTQEPVYTLHILLSIPTTHYIHYSTHNTTHCSLHTQHYSLLAAHTTLFTARCTHNTIHCSLHTTLFTARCTHNTTHYSLYTQHYSLVAAHTTLLTAHYSPIR